MNLTTLLVAAALATAAPVAYLATQPSALGPSGAASLEEPLAGAEAEPATRAREGTLRIVIEHHGIPLAALIRVEASGGETVHFGAMPLTEGYNLLELTGLRLGSYDVSVQHPLLSSSQRVDLSACPSGVAEQWLYSSLDASGTASGVSDFSCLPREV